MKDVIDLDDKPSADLNPFKDGGTYPDLAEQAKSDLQLSQLAQDHYLDDSDYHEEFFENMVEDFGMWDGKKHWQIKDVLTNKIVNVEKQMAEQGKVVVTKNKIFPMVNLIAGIESQEPLEMRAIDRTGQLGPVADGISEVLKYTWDQNKGPEKVSQQFKDMIKVGRGWLEVSEIDSEDERDIFGTKTMIYYVDPGEITYDRNSRENDINLDCDHLLRMRVMSRSLAVILWPDKKDDLNEYFVGMDTQLATARYDNPRLSVMRRSVFILEDWYKVYKLKHFLLDSSTGNIHDVSDIADKDSQAIGALVKQTPNVKIIRKRIKVMKYIRTPGPGPVRGILLDAGDSPYKDTLYPYVPMFGYRSRDLDFGTIRQVVSPQREINKRGTQELYLLNTMPKTRLVCDDPKAADDFEQGKDIVVMPKGSSFQIIPPPQISQGHARLEEVGKDDIKTISGVNDNLQGIRKGNEAGIVVNLRQRQGMTMIAELFGNRMDTQEVIAKVLMSRIRQYRSPQEIAKILGPAKANPQVIQGILSIESEEVGINIIESPSTPSLRYENMDKLDKLLKEFPELKPFIVEPYIEATDIPQKEQIIQNMKNAMQQQPPGSSAPVKPGTHPAPGMPLNPKPTAGPPSTGPTQ